MLARPSMQRAQRMWASSPRFQHLLLLWASFPLSSLPSCQGTRMTHQALVAFNVPSGCERSWGVIWPAQAEGTVESGC